LQVHPSFVFELRLLKKKKSTLPELLENIIALITSLIALFHWFEDSEGGENWAKNDFRGKPCSAQNLSKQDKDCLA
jgi:hypothetical protein